MHTNGIGHDRGGFVFPETLILSLLLMGSQSLRLAFEMLGTEDQLPGSLLAYAHLFPALENVQQAIEVLQPDLSLG